MLIEVMEKFKSVACPPTLALHTVDSVLVSQASH